MMRCCTPLAFPARAATTLRIHASAQRIHKTEPVVLDHHVLAFDVFIEACTERDGIGHGGVRRPRVYESDHRHRRLLRARRERPCDRRAAESQDELAAFHSITSSARASRVGGMAINAACRQISGLS
jgi:hypothetical protein